MEPTPPQDPNAPQTPATPPPASQTGSHALPNRRKTTMVPNLRRQTTGTQMLPRRTTGSYNLPHGSGHAPGSVHGHHAPARRGDSSGTMMAVGAIVLVGLAAVAFFVMRDTWEQDNRAAILSLRSEAEAARNENQKKRAFQKYEQIVHLVGKRSLRDSQLAIAADDARVQMPILMNEMEKEEEAIVNGKKVRNPQELKAREEATRNMN